MTEYLLACTCGQKTAVSAVQAGETIHCACGAPLQVPSMRGLRELEPAGVGETGRRVAHRWEDRHRVAFLLLLAMLGCLGVAGYLWARLPQVELPPEPPASGADIRTAREAFQWYHELQNGLPVAPTVQTPEAKTRQQMLWGIVIAAALAALGGTGALVALLKRSPGRR